MTRQETKRRRWLLSVQLIADELEELLPEVTPCVDGDRPRLAGCSLYFGQKNLREDTLYVLPGETCGSFPVDSFCYAASGVVDGKAPHICGLGISSMEILDKILEIFRKYQDLELELSGIVTDGGTISDLLVAAGPVFRNPMYVHDNMFAVIALPRKVEGMLSFDKAIYSYLLIAI